MADVMFSSDEAKMHAGNVIGADGGFAFHVPLTGHQRERLHAIKAREISVGPITVAMTPTITRSGPAQSQDMNFLPHASERSRFFRI